MLDILGLFRKSDAQDWLATLVGPAALFSRGGQIMGGNEAFFAQHPAIAIDKLLTNLVEQALAFRISKAVRLGLILDETHGDLHIRVGPIGNLSLVRLYAAQSEAPVGDAASPPPDQSATTTQMVPSLRTGLEQLIAEAPVGIARLDRRDARVAQITEANPAFARITGGGIGARLSDLIASADAGALDRLEVGHMGAVELDLAADNGATCEAWLLADGADGAAL
ncbi:MAG: hypothetical protein RLZZ157_1257, partial [Pseudomonadota bacterium]